MLYPTHRLSGCQLLSNKYAKSATVQTSSFISPLIQYLLLRNIQTCFLKANTFGFVPSMFVSFGTTLLSFSKLHAHLSRHFIHTAEQANNKLCLSWNINSSLKSKSSYQWIGQQFQTGLLFVILRRLMVKNSFYSFQNSFPKQQKVEGCEYVVKLLCLHEKGCFDKMFWQNACDDVNSEIFQKWLGISLWSTWSILIKRANPRATGNCWNCT